MLTERIINIELEGTLSMMINKRLINTVRESKPYIAGNVICQWISLTANIAMMGAIAYLLQSLYNRSISSSQLAVTAAIAVQTDLFCRP